jgi:hypothetical protein
MKGFSTSIILLLGLLLAGCGTGVKETRIAFKFEPGQKQQYINEVKISAQIYDSAGKLTNTSNLSYQSTLYEEVISAADSSRARIRLTDIVNRPSSSGSAFAADSITHKWSIECLMGTNGKVLDIYPGDSISHDILNFYKNYYEQALPVFPEKPVREGDSWKQTIHLMVRQEGAKKAETEYKIRSFVREGGYDCAIIEYKGNMILPFQGVEKDGSLVVKLERVNTKGVIYFAYNEGLIIRQQETYNSENEGTRTSGGEIKSFKVISERISTTSLVDSGT